MQLCKKDPSFGNDEEYDCNHPEQSSVFVSTLHPMRHLFVAPSNLFRVHGVHPIWNVPRKPSNAAVKPVSMLVGPATGAAGGNKVATLAVADTSAVPAAAFLRPPHVGGGSGGPLGIMQPP
jgi:hypothetical protein